MKPGYPEQENKKFSLVDGSSSLTDVTLGAFVNDNDRSHQCSFMIEVKQNLSFELTYIISARCL